MPRASTRPTKGKTRQTRRTKVQQEEDEVPEVYREMLADEEARNSQSAESNRPVKRRKVGERVATSVHAGTGHEASHGSEARKDDNRQLQTAYDYDASSDDESDIEWEDIDIQQVPSDSAPTPVSKEDEESLQITFGPGIKETKKIASRHKPLSGAEKKVRLDTHKAHLLCLLRHVQIRNRWCNDTELQDILKPMLSRNIISMMNSPENHEKFTRSRTFMNGLNLAADVFGKRFRITEPGMRRAHWAPDSESLREKMKSIMFNTEVFLSKDDFIKQSKTLSGSRDFGAQLFCALLRSAAVEARIVCSLQPLPFSGTTKDMMPGKPKSYYATIYSDRGTSTDEPSKTGHSVSNASRPGVRRLGQPQFAPSKPARSASRDPPTRPRESSYPVFWVEAYNEAVQKWITADPLVTKTLAKPFKFEPPASDHLNIMSYVVAFEEDTTARDVTRRYASAFNAKTRKLRVESTKGGETWWNKTMSVYEKPFMHDRDIMEIGELTSKTAGEPMPRNVQDFKDHPFYALERQLRRNEAIFPKRVIGHVAVGKSGSKNQGQEPVYRRSDVHLVRSADGWYRLGRDIKIGEQPLKRVRAHPGKSVAIDRDDDGFDTVEKALYAEYQTQLYKPPPVIGGKVPKNAYGNLDVYVPSMVPPGGIHIKHPDATQAAKVLGIDYSPAVTGFEFRGRHGTAIFQGIVVASEYRAAIESVMEGLEDERREAELEKKSAQALRLWTHFLLRLRIAERVKSYAVEGDDEPNGGMSDAGYEEPDDTAGGFLPENDQGSGPALGEPVCDHAEQDGALGGGFIPDERTNRAEPMESTQIELGHTPQPARQRTERPSHYTLVVVPKDEIQKNESNLPESDSRPSQRSIAASSEAQPANPEGDIRRDSEVPSEIPAIKEPSTAANPESSSSQEPSHPTQQSGSRENTHEPGGNDSDSDYQGSMLSEDPEDVDSFPEWLL